MIAIDNRPLPKIVIDTSSLMNERLDLETLLNCYNVIINIVTLEELDKLKSNKDPARSRIARSVIRKLEGCRNNIEFDLSKELSRKLDFPPSLYTNDDIIISCADAQCAALMTQDINMKIKAAAIGVECKNVIISKSEYTGYKTVSLTNEEMASLYEDRTVNRFKCLVNQYLIVQDMDSVMVDVLKWDGEKYVNLKNKTFESSYFGKVKPYNGDIYQKMAFDSLSTNKITMLNGDGGSGKTYISLGCLFNLLETRKIDKIIIFCNTVATMHSARLGSNTGRGPFVW